MYHFFSKSVSNRLTKAPAGFGKAAATVAIGVLLATAGIPSRAWAQASPYKDQGEIDVATAAQNEKDLQKKLDKLKEWEQKYPDSQLKSARVLMQAGALHDLAMGAYGKTSPAELLDSAQKAGQQLADNMDNYFSAANKPAQMDDKGWAGAKSSYDLQTHSVLGWIAYTKKQNPVAEAEFKKVLALDPQAAQVSYWLGSVIIRQGDVKRYSEALYSIARAVTVTGPEALPAANKTAGEEYLKKAYVGYHGDDSGLDQLKAATAAGPIAPADFHIKSVTEIEEEKYKDQAAYCEAHKDVCLWRQIRTSLTGDAAYFDQVKETQIPPDAIGMFKAKVVSITDKDIVVNVDNAGGDATLKFGKTVNAKVVNVGDSIEFKGEVASFNKDPYMLSLTIDAPTESVKGLPDNAFTGPAAAKKAAPKKTAPKAAPKKK